MSVTDRQQQQLDELKRLCQEWGGFVSPGGAANLVGVARSSVEGWMQRNTVRHVRFEDLGIYVSLADCIARKKGYKEPGGRPKKPRY